LKNPITDQSDADPSLTELTGASLRFPFYGFRQTNVSNCRLLRRFDPEPNRPFKQLKTWPN